MHLEKQAVQTIEQILETGQDVEIRKNRHGITIASVNKRLMYPPKTETENNERASVNQNGGTR